MRGDTIAPVLQQRLLAEQLSMLARQFPVLLAGSAGLGAGCAFVLGARGLDPVRVAAWLATLFVVLALRSLVVLFWRRCALRWPLRRWAWAFTVGSGITGLVWGSLAILFFTPQDPLTLAFVAIVQVSILASGINSLGAYFPAHLAFGVPCVLPFVGMAVHAGGTPLWALGALGLFLLGAMELLARSTAGFIRASILLRFENAQVLDQLAAAKERAESADRAKSRLLAGASHDLRQPLHALSLFASALRGPGAAARAPEDIADIASGMQQALGSVGQLLDVLLDLSRLDAGVVQPQVRPCHVPAMLATVEAALRDTARSRGLALRVRSFDGWVSSDPGILHSILLNFATNAVRYTRKGGVLVGCRRRGAALEIQVWDTGIGIPPQDLPQIDQEYYQAANARQDDGPARGFGLGLAIVRRSAQLIGARLAVRSLLGRGSMFSVTVPLCAGPAEALVATPRRQLHAEGSVLVIDNDEQILAAMRHVIGGWGHEIVCARSADEAVLAALGSGTRIDRVLADYHLGNGATGLTAIEALRGCMDHPLRAAVISADTSAEIRARVEQSDALLLHKPVDTAALRDFLAA